MNVLPCSLPPPGLCGPGRISRRGALAVVAASLAPAHTLAAGALLLMMLPSIATGVLALLGLRQQLAVERERHDSDRDRSREALMLERQRLAMDWQAAQRNQRVTLLTTLLQFDEDFRRSAIEQLMGNVAVDRAHRHPVTALLADDLDGRGSRVGLRHGHLAVQRGDDGGWIDNQLLVDLARTPNADAEDPLPVPVTGFVRDLNRQMTNAHQERFAQSMRTTVDDVRRNWVLAGERKLSRARRPSGHPDTVAAAFMPAKGNGAARYAVTMAG
ncbi:hypothetical protein HLB44_31525 [Aquincola sp. S2]|uniref:Uncharacterized protein n=1 Tax=Pseudaquabacterium terrae TaxID=2732868 RepID=A0ABX2ESF1_9BURK|nr:hypothetical protein [Aquabacterium terrae]NRF71528.1 hypothetical protein [Aquabacterium terrae]